MTVRQKRAWNLAVRIIKDQACADQLNDHDWTLLLLAAGLNSVSLTSQKVAVGVLAAFDAGTGYFESEEAERPRWGLHLCEGESTTQIMAVSKTVERH